MDIRRAFNALPREPVWHLLRCLNFPPTVLHAWSAFVSQQQRRFRVRKSVSEPYLSCTGFPEGCALSVFAMVLIDMMLDAWLHAMTPKLHSLHTFVDDWHVLAATPECLLQIWQKLLEFAQMLELEVDASKSFMWAAHSSDRKCLQEGPVQVMLASKALGAHHNFCKRKGNRAVVDRVNALSTLWPRFRTSFSSLKVKARILFQLAWPRAFYGVSVVHLGQNHYVQLRTGALRGLRSSRIGASPLLHLASYNLWCDPEAWSILQTFREVREVSNYGAVHMVLQLIGARHIDVPQNGPASVLVARASRLGWTLLPSGLFCDHLGVIDIFSLPWDSLVARVKWAWPYLLGAEHSHRRSFQGLHLTCLDEAHRSLSRFSTQDQIFLRCAMDGTLYQDVTKDKSNRGHSSLCQYCQAQDSFYHRIWSCPEFKMCREAFPWPQLIPELPMSLTCHGWPLRPAAWSYLQGYFNSLVVPEVQVTWSTDEMQSPIDFFVDGTCAWPAEPSLRYSAWCITKASSCVSTLDHQIIAAGHTVGHAQSAFRAELEAMVEVMGIIAKGQIRARVWSDCLGVIRGTRRIMRGFPIKPNKSHSDLWYKLERAVNMLAVDQVSLVKVVSHAACSQAVSGVEEWAFWHNKLVDSAAASYNSQRPMHFWSAWQQTHDSLQCGRQLHGAIQKVLIQVARRAHTLRNADKEKPQDKDDDGLDASAGANPAPLPQSWSRNQWNITGKLIRRYKRSNIEAVHHWWQLHGVPALQSRAPFRWISGLQLFVDFFCCTGFQGCLSPRHGVWYDSPEDDALFRPGLGQRSTMFLRIWNAYCKENQAGCYWQMSYKAGCCRDRILDYELASPVASRKGSSYRRCAACDFWETARPTWTSECCFTADSEM